MNQFMFFLIAEDKKFNIIRVNDDQYYLLLLIVIVCPEYYDLKTKHLNFIEFVFLILRSRFYFDFIINRWFYMFSNNTILWDKITHSL